MVSGSSPDYSQVFGDGTVLMSMPMVFFTILVIQKQLLSSHKRSSRYFSLFLIPVNVLPKPAASA
jgi:hypothetical protein